eukprot:SAG31_NODE_44780_length_261_cov_0.833333_1_plen_41_part_01
MRIPYGCGYLLAIASGGGALVRPEPVHVPPAAAHREGVRAR